MILVSSCLLGLNTKYDGKNNIHSLISQYTNLGKYIPVCPEQLGGLSTPRPPVEITKGSREEVINGNEKVVDCQGEEFTREFIRGAEEVLKIAKTFPVKAAILKERSPSCGSSQIYDGSFKHQVIAGQGVTTALLRKYNIPVYSEEEITEELMERLISDCK